jgi:peptidoglycan hydrolase-like protein with peptidoglycan-binding domain
MKWLIVCLFLISGMTALAADAQTRNVQQQLSDLGFYYGEVDGVAGPETEAAIRRFQIRNGISVTGTLTPETAEKLGVSANRTQVTAREAQRPRPAQSPAPSIIESDRAFLDSDTVPRADDDQTEPSERNQSPQDDQWRDQPRRTGKTGLDVLFAGTPLARADREVKREMLMRAQVQLRRYRYYFGDIDGIPGQMTTRAILDFQWDEELRVSGRLDSPTLRALGLRYGGFRRSRRYYEEPPRRFYRGYWVR